MITALLPCTNPVLREHPGRAQRLLGHTACVPQRRVGLHRVQFGHALQRRCFWQAVIVGQEHRLCNRLCTPHRPYAREHVVIVFQAARRGTLALAAWWIRGWISPLSSAHSGTRSHSIIRLRRSVGMWQGCAFSSFSSLHGSKQSASFYLLSTHQQRWSRQRRGKSSSSHERWRICMRRRGGLGGLRPCGHCRHCTYIAGARGWL